MQISGGYHPALRPGVPSRCGVFRFRYSFAAVTHVQLRAVNQCADKIKVSFIEEPSASLPTECLSTFRRRSVCPRFADGVSVHVSPTECLSTFRWEGFLLPGALER